jgi:hypothetical protein
MAKFNIEDLKKEYSAEGWVLLADKYENLSTIMECQCPKNHLCFMTYDKWRKYKTCPTCSKEEVDAVSLKDEQVAPKKAGVKRLLVFDQAVNTTGWAVFDDNALVQYGKFSSKGSTSEEKINFVKNKVRGMIVAWRADYIVLEDIQLQNFEDETVNTIGVTTFKSLAWLQGVLINLFYEMGAEYRLAHTGTWRKHCGIKGRSRADKKKSAQLLVEEFYGKKVSQDEADAICIGRYGLSLFKKASYTEWI